MLNNPGLPLALIAALLIGLLCGPAQRWNRLLILSLAGSLVVEAAVAFFESAKWLSTYRFGQHLLTNLLLMLAGAAIIVLFFRLLRSRPAQQSSPSPLLVRDDQGVALPASSGAGRQGVLAHALGLTTWLVPVSGALLTLANWLRVRKGAEAIRTEARRALEFQAIWTVALLVTFQLPQLHPLLAALTIPVWLAGLGLNLREVHRTWRTRA